MRQQKYTNVILTANVILLAALTWTQVAETPLLASQADAQVRTRPVSPKFPNASEQRTAMANEIAQLQSAVRENTAMLSSGNIKVEVTNLSELLIDNN